MNDTDFDPLTETKHKRLKLDWTISVGNIITLAGLFFAVIAAWNVMDKRVLVLEEAKSSQMRRDDAQDAATVDRLRDIKEAIKDVKDGVNELRREQAQRSKP